MQKNERCEKVTVEWDDITGPTMLAYLNWLSFPQKYSWFIHMQLVYAPAIRTCCPPQNTTEEEDQHHWQAWPEIMFAWSNEVELLLRTTTQLFHSCRQQKKTCWLSPPFSSATFTWYSAKFGEKMWWLIKSSHKKTVCLCNYFQVRQLNTRCAKCIAMISVCVSGLSLGSSYSMWSHVCCHYTSV